MNPSDPHPRLPVWPFIATDAALIAAAVYIKINNDPLTVPATIAIVACLGLGAIIGLVPLMAHYERRKNEILDVRQRALEGLAHTVTASVEQLRIASNGLHEVAEIAHKNVRHAEHLPQKLQEKIAEFQAQLATTVDAEKEELERELLALRTTESERLETVSQRVAKSTTEWTKLETATQQHLSAANDALAKFSARATAVMQELDAKIARLEAAVRGGTTAEPASHTNAETVPAQDAVSQPPKRPRNTRRPEPAATEPMADVVTTVPFRAAPAEEPPPVPAAKIVEIAPVAPGTAEPFSGNLGDKPKEVATPPADSSPPPEAEPPVAAGAKEPRKRAPKKPAATEDRAPALDLDESASTSAASVAERMLTSDGATRLIVTAYIGIGNRLFIRGAGPGLSWEKGVPLQFLSIGKWRWETNDATDAVKFKLYKNDEVECAALGSQSLEPGHQQELTAAF